MSDFRARPRARGRQRQTNTEQSGRNPGAVSSETARQPNVDQSQGAVSMAVAGQPGGEGNGGGIASSGNGGARPKEPTLAQRMQGMQVNPSSNGRGRGRGLMRAEAGDPVGAPGNQGAAPGGRGRGVSRHCQDDALEVGIGRGFIRGRRRGGIDSYRTVETRPQHVKDNKCGDEGRRLTLFANHVAIKITDIAALFQYHVDFSPEIENTRIMNDLLINRHRQLFGTMRPIFDGSKCTTNVHFPNPVTELVSPHPVTGEMVTVALKFLNELPKWSPEFLHITNVMFRNFLKRKLDMTLIGRNYYSTTVGNIQIPKYRVEVLSGYETSILQFEHGLSLEIDLSHKILRTDTAYDVLSDIQQRARQTGRDRDLEYDMQKAVTGQILMTKYNNRTYRVKDLDVRTTPKSTFKMGGKEVTYQQYFSQRYGISNLDPDQGMLVVENKQRNRETGKVERGNAYLPPEVCHMTGITESMRSNFHTMMEIDRHTKIGPANRMSGLQKFLPNTESLREYGYQFGESLLQVQARQITDVRIVMGKQKSFEYDPQAAEWSRQMRGNHILTPIPVTRWLVVCCLKNREITKRFAGSLIEVCAGFGINMGQPQIETAAEARDDSIIRTLHNTAHENLDLVAVVLPSSRKSLYDAVKKKLCIEQPIPSQCVIAKTLEKPRGFMSVVTKIGLQVQAKVGGELWHVKTPKLPQMMVVGIDTYHDANTGRGNQQRRSVVGMVASLSSHMTRYHSKVTFQGRNEEIATGLHTFMASAIKAFHRVNKEVPAYIMVYRDGVGDGQLEAIRTMEIKSIDDALVSLNLPQKPKLTYIIVKKRINTRFFAQMGREVSNPLPGTVVDNTVTRPEWYDFFLVSQSVRQGTVTPTHYNVIRDDSQWPPNRIQKLSYWLTHLYYNWPGTIRVPAPCQYAHKMAFLHGQSLHEPSHPRLADKLFYL